MNTLGTILASVLSSTVVVGLFIFILKNYFLNKLNKDLENHKYALQREILKAQLVGNHSAEIYKKMYELIEISYGVVMGKLRPFQFTTDWTTVGAEDVEVYLKERKASIEATAKIKKSFAAMASDRVKQVNDIIKMLDNFELSQSHQEAKNFIISNSLFIEQDIEDKAYAILIRIYAGCTAFHMWAQHGDREFMSKEHAKSEEIRKDIDELKISIKSILMPSSRN